MEIKMTVNNAYTYLVKRHWFEAILQDASLKFNCLSKASTWAHEKMLNIDQQMPVGRQLIRTVLRNYYFM